MNFTQEIIETLHLDPNLQIKKAIRGYNGITIYSLIDSVINTLNLEDASYKLGYKSKKPVKDALAEHIAPLLDNPPGFLTGGKSSWRYVLLELIDHKLCHQCGNILPFSRFGLNSNKGLKEVRH